ncbi:tripartite motif-containing protein 72-like isoform X2 [Lethenteron reissneri]|uniref:tripartite motif-containing protein 72-like isoform X2 n=1 Tax=Lethenteron reissneri TaxID=7753 RepID=UPI002AB62D19|nr:tripartite motif-containing protein 72-like isoform X2 [Lethenteron reissneri]
MDKKIYLIKKIPYLLYRTYCSNLEDSAWGDLTCQGVHLTTASKFRFPNSTHLLKEPHRSGVVHSPETMASSRQEDDFSCPICLQLFDIPVSLACGHNFCKICVERAWDVEAVHVRFTCPQCRRRYALKPELGKNVFIADLVEKFKAALRSKCRDHTEPMRYYCQTHACLVCPTCMLVGGHKGCDAITVEEKQNKVKEAIAGENRRMEKEKTTEEKSVTSLKNSFKSFQDLTENVRDRIKESFALERRLLDEEEQEALWGVQEKSRQELSRIQKKIEAHVKNIETLTEDIGNLKKVMALQDSIAFLEDDQVTSRLIKIHIEERNASSRPPERRPMLTRTQANICFSGSQSLMVVLQL